LANLSLRAGMETAGLPTPKSLALSGIVKAGQ